eukprot:COSAG06_NODE_818_length_12113_cov_9.211670_10_plen_77_part_00
MISSDRGKWKENGPFLLNKIAFSAGIDPVGLPLVAFGADEELLLRVWLWMAVTALLIKFLLLDGKRERERERERES